MMAQTRTTFGPALVLGRLFDWPFEAVLARRARCVACGRAVRPRQRRVRVRGLLAHHHCAFGPVVANGGPVVAVGDRADRFVAELTALRDIVLRAEHAGLSPARVLTALGHPVTLLDALRSPTDPSSSPRRDA
jgi:hypothetical protein